MKKTYFGSSDSAMLYGVVLSHSCSGLTANNHHQSL